MANHVLRNEYRNVPPTIVHRDRMTDHQREDGGAPGPALDDPLVIPGVHIFYLLKEFGLRVRTLL
jgi:hypothetical protein